MPTKVVKIDPYLTVDGEPVPVSGFSIILLENAVPTIKCVIDYKHKFMDPPDVNVVNTVDPLMEAYEKFKEKVNKESQCYFELKIEEDGRQVQHLKVTDWILENVGIEETTVGGTMGVVVTFSHPMCKLNRYTFRLDGIINTLDVPYASGSDALDAFIEGITSYKEEIERCQTPQKLNRFKTEVIQMLDKAINLLEEKIKYDGKSTILYLDSQVKDFVYAWISNLLTSEAEDNLWSILVNNIVPGYYLRIRPDKKLDDPLIIGPAEYWDIPIAFNQENVVGVLAPPITYNKVNRVYFAYCDLVSEAASEEVESGDKEAMGDEKSFAAIYPEDTPKGNGLTQYVGPPIYYAPMANEAAMYMLDEDPSTGTNTVGEDIEEEQEEDYKFGEELVNHMQKAFLPASLQKLYMKDSAITVKSRLNVGNDDTPLPGLTYIIGKLRFYCTSIVHSVSIPDKLAVTEYSGQYCTMSKGGEDKATQSGAKNALYTEPTPQQGEKSGTA